MEKTHKLTKISIAILLIANIVLLSLIPAYLHGDILLSTGYQTDISAINRKKEQILSDISILEESNAVTFVNLKSKETKIETLSTEIAQTKDATVSLQNLISDTKTTLQAVDAQYADALITKKGIQNTLAQQQAAARRSRSS